MRYAYQFKQKIDNVFDLTKQVTNDETKSALSKYLCILVSGYIELNIKEIILEYTGNKSNPNIKNYVEFTTQGMTNLKSSKIIENLNRFNQDWGSEFEKNISLEQKDAVDTIIANRNNIAHGKDVGISYSRISDYYVKSQQVISIIETIIK